MAKLKLDLHEIYNDGARIEAALDGIIREAEEKRIGEVEIIPGKGSGALKKTVLRFLERPDIRSRYHRIVKDGDNWGRLFVYFRWTDSPMKRTPAVEAAVQLFNCFCCGASCRAGEDEINSGTTVLECPSCGSPNRLYLRRIRGGTEIEAQSGY